MEDELLTVDSFLGQLKSEGLKHSEGKWTITLDQAREKLAEHQLESPQDYLLKLIQAGVAARASQMELHSRARGVRFLMRDVAFPSQELAKILMHLLSPVEGEHGRALRHLATAVNSALLTRATGLQLRTFDGEAGETLVWNARGLQRSPWRPKNGRPQLALELKRTAAESLATFYHLLSQRDIFAMLTGSRHGVDWDRQLVMDRASWCPVPLRLNGRWLPRPKCGPSDGASTVEKSVTVGLAEGDPGVRSFIVSARSWPWSKSYLEPVGGIAGMGNQSLWRPVRSELQFILDGVEVGSVALESVPKTLFGWGVLSAHGCTTDLTGLRTRLDGPLELIADKALQVLSELTGVRVELRGRSLARPVEHEG